MLAPPCGSFSNALFWTGRLQSSREPWGLSKGLNAKQRAKVLAANKIVRAIIGCVKALHKAGLPWIVEKPETSVIWFLPFFANIVDSPSVRVVQADHCRFAKQWKKRTRFICGNIDDDDDLGRLSKTCCGTRGNCRHTDSGRYFQFQGASPLGQLWTTLAAAYPTQTASAIAHALTARDLGRLVSSWKF